MRDATLQINQQKFKLKCKKKIKVNENKVERIFGSIEVFYLRLLLEFAFVNNFLKMVASVPFKYKAFVYTLKQ